MADESKDRPPRAIRLDATGEAQAAEHALARPPRAIRDLPTIEPVPDEAANGLPADMPPPGPSARRGVSWGMVLTTAIGGILSLAAGLAVDNLIRDLFAANDWLGWLGSALAALAVLALLALIVREFLGLLRLRTIHELRDDALAARQRDDRKAAIRIVSDLAQIYRTRPETAHGRRQLAAHGQEVIDGADLLDLAERDLLLPLDLRARAMVMNSAKRVSIVTAISPRALVDILFVLAENLRLIRQISQLYGGRPGTIGFWRLARDVITHLATTGAIAVGDGIVQQLVGHGLAARLSARLGEGVVNGLLTARVGIAAIDLCRPLPFMAQKRPGISDFLGELTRSGGLQRAEGNENLTEADPDRDPLTGRRIR